MMRNLFILLIISQYVLAQDNVVNINALDTISSEFVCDGQVNFELITGYVYSSSDDIIDSKHRTLEVADCIQSCLDNFSCRAINFETGLCVLFKSSAGENSATLSVSQLPVFTLYAQKICLPKGTARCSSPWAYETIPGIALHEDFSRSNFKVFSRIECALMCLQESETCKSASYSAETGTCKISEIDRNMNVRRKHIRLLQTEDLIEVSCRQEKYKLCEFEQIRGKILKTVDSVFQEVGDMELCKQMCLDSSYGCHSFDYNSAGDQVCRLSHHSRATLSHIQEPYIQVDGTVTNELGGCYKVNVECRGDSMKASVKTSSYFNGKIYAKSLPNSCFIDIKEETTSFEFYLPYNDIHCGVTQEVDGLFSADVVIQHHDMIVTSSDIVLALRCTYQLANAIVTNSLLSGLEVKDGIETEYVKETIVASPNVTMDIVASNGEEIIAAQVGDSLVLHFKIAEQNSPYEIFVREVVALDGVDGAEILLVDENGCPTDTSIMGFVRKAPLTAELMVDFQAFKFPMSDVVQFRALVTPCLPTCEPTNCPVPGLDGFMQRSFGKRKRRSVEERPMLVAKSVRITDKFTFKDRLVNDVERKTFLGDDCLSFTALLVTGILFIISQVSLLVVWRYMWQRKRSVKHISPHSESIPPELIYGSLSSRTTSTSYLNN